MLQHAGCVLCCKWDVHSLVSAFQAREPCTPDAFMCAPTQGRLGVQAEQFSYCQPWMLAWGYRKQNLIAELVSYNADIMCLQVAAMLSHQA